MNEFRSASDLPPDKAEIVELMGWAAIFQVEAEKLKRQAWGLKGSALLEVLGAILFVIYFVSKLDGAEADALFGRWAPQNIVFGTLLSFIVIAPMFRRMSQHLRQAGQHKAQATLLLTLRDHILMTNGEPASPLVKQLIGNAIAWIDFNNITAPQIREQIEFLTLETAKLSGTKSL